MTLVIFILVLSVLVLVHEWGHFYTARKAGAKVEEFGIGFPPRLFSWKRGGVRYCINLIPFGGYVKIFGEDEAEMKEPGSFGTLPISRRALVLVAGVVMNMVLAVVLLAVVSGLGRPEVITPQNQAQAQDIAVRVLEVAQDSPAQEVGLQAGDKLISAAVRGSEITIADVPSFQGFIQDNAGEEVNLSIQRAEEKQVLTVTPRKDAPENEGAIGISLARTGTVASPWWRTPWDGLVATLSLTGAVVSVFAQLIASIFTGGGGEIVENLAGPIGIASLTGDAARLGIAYLLQFTAVFSINLAILNILPFPALDGGRLVFLAVEKFKGSPVDKGIEHAINFVGFALLIGLLVWVTIQDIIRFL